MVGLTLGTADEWWKIDPVGSEKLDVTNKVMGV